MAELHQIRGFVFDMDGVLWRGTELLPGVEEIILFLRDQAIPFTLATNNATRTPQDAQKKLARINIHIEESKVITSSIATANYLRKHLPQGSPIYVLGESALRESLQDVGFKLCENADKVSAVVVGASQSVTYKTLAEAARGIMTGAQFIGTNPDPTFPSESGLLPGAGAILAFIETAAKVKPTIIGKPEPYLYLEASDRLGTLPMETMVVGDRLETDILGGQRASFQTALVLTGVTTKRDLEESPIQPQWIFENLLQLYHALKDART